MYDFHADTTANVMQSTTRKGGGWQRPMLQASQELVTPSSLLPCVKRQQDSWRESPNHSFWWQLLVAHTPWIQYTVVTSALRRHSSSILKTQSINKCDLLSLVDPTYTDGPCVTLWHGIKEFMMMRMLMFTITLLQYYYGHGCYCCSYHYTDATATAVSPPAPATPFIEPHVLVIGLSILHGLIHLVPQDNMRNTLPFPSPSYRWVNHST